MTLNDVYENWEDLKLQKKVGALQAVIRHILYEEDDENHDELMKALVRTAIDFENNDYFGTEGLVI